MHERNAFLYPEALAYLSSFEQSKIKLGLQRIQRLLEKLGQPQRSFRTIHVAGTNGKGSVAAMLDSFLSSDNRLIGRFCSPHLITPRERILVDSRPITRQWFSASLSYLRDILADNEEQPSYFELMTALAFYVFRFMEVDTAIVETGLGGRLDATNTLVPELAVITSISLDHTSMLGESVPAIALEKAGIIKPGVPVVALENTEAFPWIANAAKKMCAPVIPVVPEFLTKEKGHQATVRVKMKGKVISATSPLKGSFQGENLALALAAFHVLTGETGDVSNRLSKLNWPGRMEILPTSPPILLDGAHNPAGMEKFLDSAGAEFDTGLVVFGCMRDKNAERMYRMLRKRFRHIVLTSGGYHRFMDRNAFEKGPIFDSPYLKISQVIENMGNYPSVVVTGSLHLVGDFLKSLAIDHTYREVLLGMEPYCDIFDSDPA
ncbi:MAG: bifunctional folylpolyglutamate synthase/dihydrofolate synthase [Acidobacteria bacterium CG_4_9_14_3_um_filter_49_7]|nr:MAG: bifunctional folylpolyglutamate synthase/dihydrofolate synthase [Acidobacteria bacterium CG_4_9_14_3_um_filter_49_7]